ncbi:hypothetical protein SF83666_b66880 (plasmid) [Sinorhizobium fredii CCBAU 83666]|nr:hypothetical protein SF83666_b66880 [Sinorhizobium fredii CCBAU 83666]
MALRVHLVDILHESETTCFTSSASVSLVGEIILANRLAIAAPPDPSQ